MSDDETPSVYPRRWTLKDDVSAVRPSSSAGQVELGSSDFLDDDVTPCAVPPRAPSVSRVPPPPPRARSLIPPRARSLIPAPNLTLLESTAPVVRTFSEPVIPVQPPPPRWDFRPFAAAGAAAFGLTLYGLSVLQLASSSGETIRYPDSTSASAREATTPASISVSAARPAPAAPEVALPSPAIVTPALGADPEPAALAPSEPQKAAENAARPSKRKARKTKARPRARARRAAEAKKFRLSSALETGVFTGALGERAAR